MTNPFAGFWMGGFEGADHVNGAGVVQDMAVASGHLQRLEEDHRRAAQAGIRCIRESIGWRVSEAPGGLIDLARAERIARSARQHGLQVCWTLMHYGLPADLNLHDDAMIERFARFAAEVARVIGLASVSSPVFNPINEIGFLAWAASLPGVLRAPNNTPAGDRETSRISGYTVKHRLARATLAAVAAMRSVEPRSRFIHVEPVVHVVAPPERPDLAEHAEVVRGWQWQAWDLISGRVEPQLGGSLDALDLVGVNHYHSSQWEVETERRLAWHTHDPRRLPLSALLAETWQRYGRPLVIAETSHVGAGRAAWLHEMAGEVRLARRNGVPVQGFCLYPLVNRPDWGDAAHWHHSGLWHIQPPLQPGLSPPRVAEPDYMAALKSWQRELPDVGVPGVSSLVPRPLLVVFSHLRWDFVRHRTWHLLTRLARDWRVVVVEEPATFHGPPRLQCFSRGPNLDVLVPFTPMPAKGFDAQQQGLLQALLKDWSGAQRPGAAPVAWITTPLALPLARALRPRLLVYDCSDELTGFRDAAPETAARESEVLAAADLVFAAGPSLAAARAGAAGQRLRRLPNGVDAAHYARRSIVGGWDADEARRLQGAWPAVRLGFAGVVDERMDLALLARLVRARPTWQFIIVGPVVKIDPSSLPRALNLQWLGEQPYRLLPDLMARWSVGLLPFALNAATLNANPLKVLEYFAAGLPVVATALPDLAALPAGTLAIAHDAVSFVNACHAALAETPHARSLRRARQHALLAGRGWDAAAADAHRWLLQAGVRQAVAAPLSVPIAGA